jgi:hypothetical protein
MKKIFYLKFAGSGTEKQGNCEEVGQNKSSQNRRGFSPRTGGEGCERTK